MAGHPDRNLSVPCAVSQSGRATCEKSQRGYPTAITSATSVTAKLASQQYKLMLGRHDNHDALKLRLVTIGGCARMPSFAWPSARKLPPGRILSLCATPSQRRLRKATCPWTRSAVRGERRRGNPTPCLDLVGGLTSPQNPSHSRGSVQAGSLPQPSKNLHVRKICIPPSKWGS
jgi:hypothetical protein